MTDKEIQAYIKSNKEYWQERYDKAFQSSVNDEELRKIYKDAYKGIEKDLKSLYDKLKRGDELTRTELLKSQQYTKILRDLESSDKTIKSSLGDNIAKTLKNAYRETYGASNEVLSIMGFPTADPQIKMMKKALNSRWSGKNWSERVWNNTEALAKDIKAILPTEILKGTSYDTLTKRIMEKYEQGYNAARTLTVTETARIQQAATLDSYYNSDVKEVEFIAEDDCCEICAVHSGKTFNLGEEPYIPQHPNCRCCIAPKVSWEVNQD